jgi:hypothetical protein
MTRAGAGLLPRSCTSIDRTRELPTVNFNGQANYHANPENTKQKYEKQNLLNHIMPWAWDGGGKSLLE